MNLALDTALSPTSVAAKEELNIVGGLSPSTTIILSVPSKLNRSNLYLPALVLPVSRTVQLSDTISLLAWAAAVVDAVALVTPVKVVAVIPV